MRHTIILSRIENPSMSDFDKEEDHSGHSRKMPKNTEKSSRRQQKRGGRQYITCSGIRKAPFPSRVIRAL